MPERHDDLMPCPFCGTVIEEPIPYVGHGMPPTYSVLCDFCRTYGPGGETKEKAAQLWNEREDSNYHLHIDNLENKEEAKKLLQGWTKEAFEDGQRRAFERIEKLAAKGLNSLYGPVPCYLHWRICGKGKEIIGEFSGTLQEAVEKAEKENNNDEHHGD